MNADWADIRGFFKVIYIGLFSIWSYHATMLGSLKGDAWNDKFP